MPPSIRSLLAGVLLLGLAVGAWFVFGDDEPPSPAPSAASADHLLPKAARGTPENPDARRAYELRRLRNPETGRLPKYLYRKERAFADQMPARSRKSGASQWQLRGPTNIGGRSRGLAVDVRSTSADTILAGGVSGGMWRTTDGGQSWTRTFEPDQRPNVTALTQDPRPGRQDVWYAGTGERRGVSASGGGGALYAGNGIYKSEDGGKSWSLLPNTTSDATTFDSYFDIVMAVEVDPTAPTDGTVGTDSEVYAAVHDRLYRTVDGGSTWTPVLTGDTTGTGNAARWTDVEVTSGGDIYAALGSGGDRSGLFYSATGKAGSWTDITPEEWPVTSFKRTVLAANPSDSTEVWAVTAGGAAGTGPNGHELWKYDRDTDTWTDSTEYLPDRNPGGFVGSFNSQRSYNLLVKVHPDDGDIVFVGGVNLWRIDVSTSDSDPAAWIGGYGVGGGGFYDPPGSDSQHPDQHAIAFKPDDGDVMFSGSDGGIHRTDNSRAGKAGEAGDGKVLWNDLNNGYFTTQFYAICQFREPDTQTERTRIAGGMQDNGTWNTASTDASAPWTRLRGADGGYCALTNNGTSEGSSRYVSAQEGSVSRLGYDANGTLQSSESIDPGFFASGQLFINPFALDPSAPEVMYYPAGSDLWRNQNVEAGRAGWATMNGASVPGETITALGVSTTNDAHVLYYGTDVGTVKRLEDADETGTGTEPIDVTDTLFPDGYVSSIAVNPTDSDEVMVVFSNYNVTSLFYSVDGGTSWTAVEGNLGGDSEFSPSVRSASILPRAGSDPTKTTFYVGTSIGLYATTTLRGTDTAWIQEGSATIGDVVVDQVQSRSYDGQVVAATHGNGAYSFNPVNAPPVAETDTFSGPAGETLAVDAPGVLGNDVDADQLSASVADGPSEGRLTLASDGAFEYTPDDGFQGTDQFTYRAVDPLGASADATVRLSVEPNVAPNAPSGLRAQKQGPDLRLNWRPVSADDLKRYRIYRDTAPVGPDALGRPAHDSVSASTSSYVDRAPAPGRTYYYRVAALDDTGQEGALSGQAFAFIRKKRVAASVDRSFGDASGLEDYRLVALPGRADTALAQTLDGEAGAEWQAYRDNGQALVRHDGSDAFDFRKGRGFWLTARGDWTVEDRFAFVTLPNDTATAVPLNDGWTIISNPFDKAVSWDAVERANGGALQPPWPFEGAFDAPADTFAPATTGRAYYFHNTVSSRDSLVIPYPGAPEPGGAAPKTEDPADAGPKASSLLALSARPARSDGPASTVRVGLGTTHTLRAPPGRFEAVSLRIDAEREGNGSLLMTSRRRAANGGHTFDVQLRHRMDPPIRLDATFSDPGQHAALLHPAAEKSYDLRDAPPVVIEPSEKTTSLRVAVGSADYVEAKEDAVQPSNVRLTTYPNPIRKQGTIEYTLPTAQKITLRVYDVLGRAVAVLASGRKTAGHHTVPLGTERLSSGVYFTRLSVEDQTVTEKITVVR